MTLSALVTDFLEYLEFEQNAAQRTIRNYDYYLKDFLEFVGDIEPDLISLDLIRKYKLHLSKKPLKKVSQNYFLIALRSFLRFLAKAKIKSLSALEVELRDQEPRPVKSLDATQINQILEMPDITKKKGLRDRAVLETLLSTGLRVSELVALNRDQTKSDWIDRYLRFRQDTFKPLFIRFQGKVNPADNGEAMRLTPRSIERIVEKYVKQAGTPVKATPQTIRFFTQQTSII